MLFIHHPCHGPRGLMESGNNRRFEIGSVSPHGFWGWCMVWDCSLRSLKVACQGTVNFTKLRLQSKAGDRFSSEWVGRVISTRQLVTFCQRDREGTFFLNWPRYSVLKLQSNRQNKSSYHPKIVGLINGRIRARLRLEASWLKVNYWKKAKWEGLSQGEGVLTIFLHCSKLYVS